MFCARGAGRIKAGGSFKNNTHRRRTRVTFGKTAAVLRSQIISFCYYFEAQSAASSSST
jgi:hypothetical protein